jgi:formamidopyrimidine-DNA glycosylase
MTGRLYVVPDDAECEADRWLRFGLQLDGGQQLRFSDSRKFGRVYLSSDAATITAKLGPEPLAEDFTAASLEARLNGRRRNIKTLLLDQSFLAGVGNIYADEALFRAAIHPLRQADQLTPGEIVSLHEAIRVTLQDAIEAEGASINWYRKPDGSRGSAQTRFLVYGRTGEACFRCGHPIEKIRVAQRGTHFCPVCQAHLSNQV